MNPALRNLHHVTTPVFMEDGTPKVRVPSQVLLEGLENQKEFIVGQFYRCAVPTGGQIHAVMSRIWGRRCRIFTRKLGEFSYLFHIPDEATRNWILQRGLWHVDDCLMFVSAWNPTGIISLPEISTIHVWLTLKNIPNQLYSTKGISWIASGLGAPMLTSKPRLDPTQMGEAKIMVEVKLDKPFPQKVAVEDESGLITLVDVLYSWLPPKCVTCGQLDHKASRCLGKLPPKVLDKNISVTPIAPGTCVPNLVIETTSTSASLVTEIATTNALPIIEKTTTVVEDVSVTATTTTGSVPVPIITVATASTEAVPTSTTVEIVTPTTAIPEADPTMTEIASPNDAPSPLDSLSSHPSVVLGTTSHENSVENPSDCRILINEVVVGEANGNNRFAVLDSVEYTSSVVLDDESLQDLLTPSAQRILRDRPVKPTKKVEEMLSFSHNAGGRGNRGRGGRGGRGGLG